MKLFAFVCVVMLAVFAGTGCVSSSLVLIDHGKSDYEIVIPKNAPKNTQVAASELQSQIEKTTKVKLSIVNKLTAGKKAIYLGENEALPKIALYDEKQYNEKERFSISKLADGSLVIMGASTDKDPLSVNEYVGDYGLLFGVYEFIEQFLGTRWYAPGEFGECIEPKDTVIVKGLPIDQTPLCPGRSFWPRIWVEFDPQASVIYCRRMRGWGLGTGTGSHSMLEMPNRFPDKPEIFALDSDGVTRRTGVLKKDYPNPKGGLRYSSFPQLCLTNPETVNAFCQFVDDVYEGRPEGKLWWNNPPGAKALSCCQNDDFSILPCYCKNCQAMQQPELGDQGMKSRLVWSFVNEVAKKIKVKYPDKKVLSLAYQDYYLPPDFKIEDNVVVGLCVNPYIMFHGAKKHFDRVDKVMTEWDSKCSEISLWHYLNPYDSYPYQMPHIMYNWHHKYPAVKSIFFELNDTLLQKSNLTPIPINKNRRCGSDFAQVHLNLYFGMRGIWAKGLDVDGELNRYYKMFYGPAEEPMKKFHTLINERWENIEGVKGTFSNRDAGFSGKEMYDIIYTAEVRDKMTAYIEEALKLAPADSLYHKRIQWLKDSYLNKFYETAGIFENSKDVPEAVNVKMVSETVAADGDLNKPLYKDLPVFKFHRLRTPLPPKFQTKLKIAASNDTLYLALDCEDPDTDTLVTQHNRNDNINLFQDDSIEIFLAPNPAKPNDFFNMTIGMKGALTDYQVINGSTNMNMAYTSDADIKIRINKENFTVEVAVPFKNIGLTPGQENSFRLNVCRNKRSGISEHSESSCWSCPYGSFWKLDNVPIINLKK